MPQAVTSQYEVLLPGVPWIESPFFEQILATKPLTEDERRVALALHHDGYAVIDFADPAFDARVERIIAKLSKSVDWAHWRANCAYGGSIRFPNGWQDDPDIRAIACNERLISLLSLLYGRRAIPFQTLNFPVGTQQHCHSDSVHFSTVPERFMCGVWVAMEDIDADNGPLIYYPGSHKWPTYANEHIGHLVTEQSSYGQPTFEPLWRALVETQGLPVERFFAKKGQALIWAANLLHGGDRHNSLERTRWSQVTHYYFEDCAYYTPLASLPALGTFSFRDITDIATGAAVPNKLMGKDVARGDIERLAFIRKPDEVPFDGAAYLAANPDVARAGVDPRTHYDMYGRTEGRPLRPA
jgi:hypothetical protein